MNNGGFIVIHRKILNWEWYNDINTKVLFLHLLLKANYKDLRFEGRDILRGQLVTSLPSLAAQTGLTIHQVRVSLDKLKMTGEVTSSSYARYRIITIVKYDDYQIDDRLDGSQMADSMAAKCQADDRLMAGSWQADDRLMAASKQYNNINKENKETTEQGNRGKTAQRFTPPTLEEVAAYCRERNNNVDPVRWFDYYESKGWMIGKNKMKDWKAAVRTWEGNQKSQPQTQYQKRLSQNYEQRSYAGQEESMEDVLARLHGMTTDEYIRSMGGS